MGDLKPDRGTNHDGYSACRRRARGLYRAEQESQALFAAGGVVVQEEERVSSVLSCDDPPGFWGMKFLM
jgi:hypothetical protein